MGDHPAHQRLPDPTTRVVLLLTVVGAAALLLAPDLRSPGLVAGAWSAVALVVLGTVRHRPRPARPWWLLALMLLLWALAATAVQVQQQVTTAATVLVGTGQVVALVVTSSLLPRSALSRAWLRRAHRSRPELPPRQPRRPTDLVPTHPFDADAHRPQGAFDGVVILTVLGLVTAQVVTAALTAGTRTASTIVLPVVDVAVLGLLLRFVASRRLLSPSSHLTVAAAAATVG